MKKTISSWIAEWHNWTTEGLCIDVDALQDDRRSKGPSIWDAKCKSGFEYRGKDGKWHACKRNAGRGMLMCAKCLEAEVAEDTHVVKWNWAWRLPMYAIDVLGSIGAGVMLVIGLTIWGQMQ